MCFTLAYNCLERNINGIRRLIKFCITNLQTMFSNIAPVWYAYNNVNPIEVKYHIQDEKQFIIFRNIKLCSI